MPEEMKLTVQEKAGDRCRLKFAGRIGTHDVNRLHVQFQGLLDQGVIHFLLDLEDLEYIASVGIGIFLDTHVTAEERGGGIRFMHANHRIRLLFELTGTLDLFTGGGQSEP